MHPDLPHPEEEVLKMPQLSPNPVDDVPEIA
jgi:hypothetical protein